MIKQIRLQNFFSFRDATISLSPQATIMVGINGSGKSNSFKAFRLLQTGVSDKGQSLRELFVDHWGGVDEVRFKGTDSESIRLTFLIDGEWLEAYGYGGEDDLQYTLTLTRRSGGGNYSLQEMVHRVYDQEKRALLFESLNGAGRITSLALALGATEEIAFQGRDPQELSLRTLYETERYPPLAALRHALSDIAVYDYFDTRPSSSMRRASNATSEKQLRSDGGNLASIISTLKINHKPSYNQIGEMLREVNEHFQGFDFRYLGSSGNLELLLDEGHLTSSTHITHLSDGTLRFLCLLAILFNPNRGSFICIDEPELGLHPDMFKLVADAVKLGAEQTQALVATHSEHILNQFSVEDIRVFEKERTNETMITSYREEDFVDWYESFSPGRMWRAGDLGGNRY